MENQIAVFNFKSNQVRTQTINGELWFCLSDCRSALGLAKTTKAQIRLPEAGVRKQHISYASGAKIADFINEPNLYRLIFRSNKPQAQAFADWVYSEVLPSIRKNGGYGVAVSQKEMSAFPTPNEDLKDWCAQAMALMIENRVRIAVEDERQRLKKLIEKAI